MALRVSDGCPGPASSLEKAWTIDGMAVGPLLASLCLAGGVTEACISYRSAVVARPQRRSDLAGPSRATLRG
jgi:hypothetical protein